MIFISFCLRPAHFRDLTTDDASFIHLYCSAPFLFQKSKSKTIHFIQSSDVYTMDFLMEKLCDLCDILTLDLKKTVWLYF